MLPQTVKRKDPFFTAYIKVSTNLVVNMFAIWIAYSLLQKLYMLSCKAVLVFKYSHIFIFFPRNFCPV